MASTLRVRNMSGMVKDTDMFGKPDPIASLRLGSQVQATAQQKNTTTPRWREELVFNVMNPQSEILEVTVQDKDTFSKEVIGRGTIPLRDIYPGYPRTQTVVLDKSGGTFECTLVAEGPAWGGAVAQSSYPPQTSYAQQQQQQQQYSGPVQNPPPATYHSTPPAIFSDRDNLNHLFDGYHLSYESIVSFFEREDRLLSEEKLQFEEWKLSEQQLINQQSAELMRKQQELKQFEADLMQFQQSIELSEKEVVEGNGMFDSHRSGFEEQRNREVVQMEAQKRALDDHQRQIADQMHQIDERRAALREVSLRQQRELAELQREAQQQAQQQLQLQQQQIQLQQQQQQMFLPGMPIM
eukprot:NODE_1231_length_1625_cov_35.359137_g1096_i0.p1 GENE.NODE_1231_length_1625_cov_35.359137_g1096_i0~~NODE_1231_length_1625_cov_35.359137_g1096_i0.p1  ORF type:complete len:353 (+),score=118.65 NODE_1231_length_1625_cov_35.359137_g1096_i0:89-1147(+)